MKNGHKFAIAGLIILQFVISLQYVFELGKRESLEDQKMVLLNLACSLDEKDFKQMLDNLSPPEKFKALGDKQEHAWSLYKEQLFHTCFDLPAT